MSFQASPQTNIAPPGTQGNVMPGFPSSSGLPPPPTFPAFQNTPPTGPSQPGGPGFTNSSGQNQSGQRPHFAKKHNDYNDKRNFQQSYRPPNSDKPTVTVFVGNITEHASDALVRQLLMKCGIVVNWKRVQGADGKLQAFGFCEYVDPETGLRAIRLLHDLTFGEKNLVVKVDQKTKEMLDEYKKKKASAENKELQDGKEELDEATKNQDAEVQKSIAGLLSENSDVLSGKFKAPVSKWRQTHSGSEENLEGLGMDKDKKHLISKEIRSFRDTYKDSQKQQRDKDDTEEDRNRDRERQRERSPPERERSKSLERNTKDRGEGRSRSRSKERDRDTRDRERENRDRDRERDRDRRDRDRDRRDRDGGDRREREGRDGKGSLRSNRDREMDEDDSYERRKRERRQKERSQAYVERLKAWETRERKKQREYDRELEKERENDSEQAREKKHLLEFLEDYDDDQDDPKYYRGSSFDRRRQARIQEMEIDEKDKQRELEEIEEIRKRLGDRAVEPESEEEPMEEEPEPEPEPEPRPTLQATFKPAVAPVVESAPKVVSPQYHSPVNIPPVNQNHKPKAPEIPQTEVDGPEVAQKKTFVFEMKSKGPVGSTNSNRKKLEAVFNSEEESSSMQNPKRKLIPLDYSEEEKKAVATAKSAEQKKKSIKSLIERIPTAKNELFTYPLDWECVDQSLIDRRIRPWVNKKIVEYIGEEEPSLVDFMCTKLLARSQPDSILHDVSMVLDDEAEVFVVKMWRLLIYETEAKKIGLVK
ncbi:RNA-binding protein 25-like [Dendronephthya gigantea]|uniref:RNA-binding protein 25-like n=1 Tax=Dendronephthya gigantea TaxID=151771 RepID=UPI00106D83EA|nr:RNA-binding protein 25-like [Dendronephthya gigantea]